MTRTNKHRHSAFIAQQGSCYYCSYLMWEKDCTGFARSHGLTMKQAAWFKCTKEHLVARCGGGTDGRENIAAACDLCNKRRHKFRASRVPSSQAYMQHVRRRMAAGKWHPQRLGRHLCRVTSLDSADQAPRSNLLPSTSS
jgi:hypothetical protein